MPHRTIRPMKESVFAAPSLIASQRNYDYLERQPGHFSLRAKRNELSSRWRSQHSCFLLSSVTNLASNLAQARRAPRPFAAPGPTAPTLDSAAASESRKI